jgi:hypothetical protein
MNVIAPPEVPQLLRGAEARERLETVHQLRAFIGSIFRFAVATLPAWTRSLRGPSSALACHYGIDSTIRTLPANDRYLRMPLKKASSIL